MPTGPILRAPARSAPVLEVFASIQGEGLFVGEPQIFCRFAGCPLRCRYCDTPASWELPREDTARTRLHHGAGRSGARDARMASGFATPADLVGWVAELEHGLLRTVSLTGGEPLLHPEFLLEFAALVAGRALHLETAGAHPGALELVLPVLDHVSLDLKLAADLDAPVEPVSVRETSSAAPTLPSDAGAWRAVRRRVLESLAGFVRHGVASGKSACAKVVVTGGRRTEEFAPLLADLADLAPELPLILQPVTPLGPVTAPSSGLLLDLTETALRLGLTCRVLPQVHRSLRLP